MLWICRLVPSASWARNDQLQNRALAAASSVKCNTFGPGHCGRATDTSRFGLNRFNNNLAHQPSHVNCTGSGSSAMAGTRHENGEGEELRPAGPSAALTSPLSPSRPPLEAPSAVDTLSTPGAPSPPAKPPLKYTVDADHIRDFPGKKQQPSDLWFRDPFEHCLGV